MRSERGLAIGLCPARSYQPEETGNHDYTGDAAGTGCGAVIANTYALGNNAATVQGWRDSRMKIANRAARPAMRARTTTPRSVCPRRIEARATN